MASSYDLLLHKLSLKYRIPVKQLKEIVYSQFEFIQNKTKELDFSNVQTKEQFDEIKKNFNVKYLFNLSASYKSLQKIKEHETKNTSD